MSTATEAKPDLRDSRELSRAILASLPAHIAVLDAQGVIIAVNEAWIEFGCQRRGAMEAVGVGANYLAVCASGQGKDSAEGSAVAEGIRAVLEGRSREFQLEYACHAASERRWFLVTVSPLRCPTGGVVVSHFDITQRKLQEEAIRRSNAELDQFAYVTSHDLRAPLRGIANLSRWIEEELGESAMNAEVRRMLELLRGRVGRMEGLIDGILQYSRVGRVKGKLQRVDVGRLVREVIDLLAPPAGVTLDITSDLPVLRSERLPLQQVFLNLIGNALKHGGRSDLRIGVSCRDVNADWIEFEVSDNGQGIESRYHEKVFVIFQTLTARDKMEGSGLGLALVKKIVESVGGSVSVESSPGRGAKFNFTWPRRVEGE